MKIKSQTGFTLVEGLLIVVVVSLISFVGYYVINANKDENTIQSDVPSSKKITKATTKTPISYMEVPEVGIKFDKSSDPGVYYEIAKDNDTTFPKTDFPEVNLIYLHSKTYNDTTNSEGKKCSDYDSDIVAVQVIKKADRQATKYNKYKNADIGPADPIPFVLSDKYSQEKNGYYYSSYNTDGVQAAPSCLSELASAEGYQAAADKNPNVIKQLKSSREALKKVIATIQAL